MHAVRASACVSRSLHQSLQELIAGCAQSDVEHKGYHCCKLPARAAKNWVLRWSSMMPAGWRTAQPSAHSNHQPSAGAVPTAAGTRLYGSRGLRLRANSSRGIAHHDLELLREAAELSRAAAGLTAPHPNAACILVAPDGRKLTSAYLRASGAPSPEVQAVQAARGTARHSTAYLNLETGDCHGEDAAVRALIQAGVSRVVVGLKHPLPHARGAAIKAFRAAGIRVDVLGDSPCAAAEEDLEAVRQVVLEANEPLLHRAARRRPMSILKYAMTLDGKIATQQGHSAWVTSPPARAMVFDARAKSDAVIVGGNTVRRDNPRLTTRRDTGHMPVRMVMSRTLDLPEDAALWDVSVAPTIVATQRGARNQFQAKLRDRGIEVVEFDFLTPEAVADYCYSRGFLQCFWECGGTLAAPCISSAVVHKLLAFVAPKVIGGARAPTPVGELGFVEMTQAVSVCDYSWQQVGPDLMLTGYLPSSGGPLALAAELEQATCELAPEVALEASSATLMGSNAQQAQAALEATAGSSGTSNKGSSATATLIAPSPPTSSWSLSSAGCATKVVPFYKAWDKWGALSNFSPHSVTLPHFSIVLQPPEPVCSSLLGSKAEVMAPPPQQGSPAQQDRQPRVWSTVEHYYQAQKFAGNSHPDAATLVQAIAAAGSPEEAARLGRQAERASSHLLTPGWQRIKVDVMLHALRAKFITHDGPRAMLLATSGAAVGCAARLVEASPNDFFWGAGYSGNGRNMLGLLLGHVRTELTAAN